MVGTIHLPFGGLIDSVGLDTPFHSRFRLGLASPRPVKDDGVLTGFESLLD